jgi:hypothetical protein
VRLGCVRAALVVGALVGSLGLAVGVDRAIPTMATTTAECHGCSGYLYTQPYCVLSTGVWRWGTPLRGAIQSPLEPAVCFVRSLVYRLNGSL